MSKDFPPSLRAAIKCRDIITKHLEMLWLLEPSRNLSESNDFLTLLESAIESVYPKDGWVQGDAVPEDALPNVTTLSDLSVTLGEILTELRGMREDANSNSAETRNCVRSECTDIARTIKEAIHSR